MNYIVKADAEKIQSLWEWFIKNEDRIIQCIEMESPSEQYDIKQSLDNLVLDLGLFSWEIGPGTNKEWSFTISPNGNRDLMNLSKEIIDEAPDLFNWEFNYFRKPMSWDRKLELYDSSMTLQKIDASAWKYHFEKSDSGIFELTVVAKNIEHLDEESRKEAAEFVITKEIGEFNKIWKVSNIFVSPPNDSKEKNLLPIDNLKGEFQHK